jgi:putative hydrolase of the HAD superfamily
MVPARAVLFDLGGTLYDYATLAAADRESLVELMDWAGVEADATTIQAAYRQSLRQVFYRYLPEPYYLHRDLFRDALTGAARILGAVLQEAHLERHRVLQAERRARDFALRDGAAETLAALRRRGLHLGLVSNIDESELTGMRKLAGLDRWFHAQLSSEGARSCKPDSGIYQQALERAGCAPEEALFVGDSLLQDVAGANRFGLRSVLLWHRDDRDPPDREPRPHHVIHRLTELLELLE